MGTYQMNTAMQINPDFAKYKSPALARKNVATHGVFANTRVRVRELSSSWALQLNGRLEELTSLQRGWDGYAGEPVSFQSAYFVANMLERLCESNVPAPSIVPGSDGSLQVEWHRNLYDVELDVLSPHHVIATRVDHRTDLEETVVIENDFSEIVDWIKALSYEASAIA